MSDFLFQAGAFNEDPYNSNYVDLPEVQAYKNGLKIEAGALRSLLTNEKFIKSLEAFLNKNGCDVFIVNTKYHSDGWVYYTVMPGFKSDQMRL